MTENLTIIEIEKLKNIDYNTSNEQLSFGLPQWYHDVRSKKLSELSDGDISRCIRQNMYLDYILEEAIKRLWNDPTVGDIYEDELLKAINDLKVNYWNEYPSIKQNMVSLLKAILTMDIIPNDFEWDSKSDKEEFYCLAETIFEKLTK